MSGLGTREPREANSFVHQVEMRPDSESERRRMRIRRHAAHHSSSVDAHSEYAIQHHTERPRCDPKSTDTHTSQQNARQI
ncbi:hypothetical protein TYRP_006203 [Tyrophagus putrescentiae]|nr:hypothetical protein TYRP_006203 [Tyrophagus putrescentiae]